MKHSTTTSTTSTTSRHRRSTHRASADGTPRLRSRGLPAALAVVAVALPVSVGVAGLGSSGDRAYASMTIQDDRISDLSGVTRSTYDRDVVWTIGGAGNGPTILGVDTDGSTSARLDVTGATNKDWQDIAAGPHHRLWVAEAAKAKPGRTVVKVLRVKEPSDLALTSVPAKAFRLRLPVESVDAVSILVHPVTGRVYVATDQAENGGLYVAPETLRGKRPNLLTKVATIPDGIAGATFAASGSPMVLVDDDTSYLYDVPGATPVVGDLPTPSAPTGVSVDQTGRSLLISSAGPDEAIYTVPVWPGWRPHRPWIPRPTLPDPGTPSVSLPPTPRPSTPSPTAPTPTTPRPTSPTPTSPTTAPSTPPTTPDPTTPGTMGVGMYSGSFSYDAFDGDFGSYPAVETTYLNADQVTTPNLSRHEAEIDRGISPVITLGYKNGPFTRQEIAEWGSEVQSYFTTFVAGLDALSDYAAKADNGTRVYFADEHEAQVKINQDKYGFAAYGSSQKPTTAQSAAAWNKVMGLVRTAAPGVVRTYWYGGSGANESTYASLLDPALIQMATFDPYRWRHNSAGDTPEKLWGSMVSTLKSQSWMRNSDGSLKPWGLTEWGTDASLGDAANATFVTAAFDFLREQGAAFAVYFNRVDGNDNSNDFVITDGSQPRTLAAFRAAMS